MLFRAGFKYVYGITHLPDHDEFRETAALRRRRTVVLASREPILLSGLIPLSEPRESAYPWEKPAPRLSLLRRLGRFFRRPGSERARSFYARWVRIFPNVPLPVRLPFGGWWLARNDFLGASFFSGGFESRERAFVQGFLKPGMTMLDVGAHHGIYTLLGSKGVGTTGRVFAFEPSPREGKALLLNLRLNRTKNVRVESCALGGQDTQTELYVVDRQQTGCNSLRPPVSAGTTSTTYVRVRRLDDWAAEHQVERADFIKLDVEGGELEFLKGAERILTGSKRPVILAEVQDLRTQAWGIARRKSFDFCMRETSFGF